jgi:hypothetical protein
VGGRTQSTTTTIVISESLDEFNQSSCVMKAEKDVRNLFSDDGKTTLKSYIYQTSFGTVSENDPAAIQLHSEAIKILHSAQK